MKKVFAICFLSLVITFALLSCEKDDICAEGTPTTPNVIVEFFITANRTQHNPVSNFKYFVEGMTDTITITTSRDSIRVPLRVDGTTTKWGFILRTPVTGGAILNTDYITFDYTARQAYVSRACGYKSTFNLTGVPALTDAPGESNLWIDEIEVENSNIENENEAHISIYY